MINMAAYSDMNILYVAKNDELPAKLELASKLRYELAAINNVWVDVNASEKKKKKDKPQPVEDPHDVVKVNAPINMIKKTKLLSRFTLILNDSSLGRMIQKDETVTKYDILAVQPTNEKMFNVACKALDVDIITFDMTERIPYYFKRAALGVAMERGVHFEICYSPMLRDSTARRNIISAAQSLVHIAKGKNIILSSGCDHRMEMRGPLDVVNLGSLFGLTADQAKAAVTTNCRRILQHAEARKTAQGVMKMTSMSEVKVKDRWLLEGAVESQDTEDGTSGSDDQRPRKKLKS